nr:reverse transcriptase domain-containing protein [Tanacetum cinerariifolium]
MSTRLSARNLFPPLDNPELKIQRRPHVDPTLLNDFEMATNENGDPPVPDLRTMKELCQLILNGRDTFYNWLTLRHRNTINAAASGTFMKRRPEECYDLIENMTAHHNDWDTSIQRTTVGQTQNVYATGAYNQGGNSYQPQGSSDGQNPPPAYQAPAYQAPGYQTLVHQAPIPQLQVVTTTEFTNYMKANDAILKNMQTKMTSLTNSNPELKNMFGQFMKMNIASSSGSGTLPMERETEVTKDTMPPNNNRSTKDVQPPAIQIETPVPNSEPVVSLVVEPIEAPEKIYQIFKDLDFNISFADALILMPRFGPTIKSLLTNKEKLFELARTPLNEHCSAVLLKKLPEKLGDPSKFLIPCDFLRMDECLALADLCASINLMPLSVWNKLSLPKLSPTCMTLELVDRLISRPVRAAKDTGRALIDVYEEELTLQYSQEVLGFSVSGNPTPSMKLIVSNSSPTLTPFEDSDFNLEETDAFLAIDDIPISLKIIDCYYDSEGDILLLEEFLNDDPSSVPLLPQELKVVEPTNEKSSIDEPPMVELKDLPPHFEYAFLEGNDKLPVIIAKDLKDEEKTALIKILKSHKQALAWKLSDIKGIDPEFCTHKILMKDDFKPAV